MGQAQAARDAGDPAGAAREYRAALEAAPEVAGVRLALADVLLEQQEPGAAIEVLSSDTTGDRAVALRLASVLTDEGDLERAEAVYQSLLARDPADRAAREGRAEVRDRRERRGLPEEYGRIPAAERVSRADLAALLAVRVPALGRNGPGEARVAVDIGGSWAKDQIASVLSYGVMDVYPNHTFQPGATVRRVDLARAAARVLERLGWPRAAAPRPTDVPRSHLDADAVDRVLGAGLMALTEAGAFEPWRPVNGREAKEVVDALARLGAR
jgi:thioredoxin-like negative regulator of GroEL